MSQGSGEQKMKSTSERKKRKKKKIGSERGEGGEEPKSRGEEDRIGRDLGQQ